MDVTSGEATAAGRTRRFALRRPIAVVRNVDVLVYTRPNRSALGMRPSTARSMETSPWPSSRLMSPLI